MGNEGIKKYMLLPKYHESEILFKKHLILLWNYHVIIDNMQTIIIFLFENQRIRKKCMPFKAADFLKGNN